MTIRLIFVSIALSVYFLRDDNEAAMLCSAVTDQDRRESPMDAV